MQNQRNYAKQELIYDLLFGGSQRKSPKSSALECVGDSHDCLICRRDKLGVAKGLGTELPKTVVELLCIECKRGLFSFEGFKYQCRQVKSSVSGLESLGVVLNEQMMKLRHLISREMSALGNSGNACQNNVPDWCNRDFPPRFGKGGFNVEETIKGIRESAVQEEKTRLCDQLMIFHSDLLNLQDTIFTFINVLEAYIDTPWVSVLKEVRSGKREAQPCVTGFDGGEKIVSPAEPEEPQTTTGENQEGNARAQRIERIRRQQEKVRQQIRSLYENANTDLPDTDGHLYFSSVDTEVSNANKLGNYFLFDQDEDHQTDNNAGRQGGVTPNRMSANSREAAGPGSQMLRNYDILWSPSSASSSNDSG